MFETITNGTGTLAHLAGEPEPIKHRIDLIELHIGATFYVSGCTAIYINGVLDCVSHPNPYDDEKPAIFIKARDMARKHAEILRTIETLKEIAV